jgi:hypothetical protein
MNAIIKKALLLTGILALFVVGKVWAGNFYQYISTGDGVYSATYGPTYVTIPSEASVQQWGGAETESSTSQCIGPLGNFECSGSSNGGNGYNQSGNVSSGTYEVFLYVVDEAYAGIEMSW